MSDTSAMSEAQQPQPYHWWKVLALAWLACVVAMAFIVGRNSSLYPVSFSFIGMSAFFGLFLGSAVFVFLVGPVQALVLLIVRLTRARGRTASFLVRLPALIITVLALVEGVRGNSASQQPGAFKSITGMPYPEGAKLLKWGHGFGLQDKRHLWVFESTPEQFETFKAAAAWRDGAGQDRSPLDDDILNLVNSTFSPCDPWSAATVYMWTEDRDATLSPREYAWLLVDKDHKRWCVWWIAI